MSGGPRIGATVDLLKRYAAVLRQAWRERQNTPPRPAHEVDFLPAALSLQEQPVSPAPRLAMALIVGFALIALIWAVFGQIDGAKTMPGMLIGFKDHAAVVQRQYGLDLIVVLTPRVRMQIQTAAPGLFPFVIEIDDQIQPAVPVADRQQIEIHMRIQALALHIFVGAAAYVFGVVQQIRDAGDCADTRQEIR